MNLTLSLLVLARYMLAALPARAEGAEHTPLLASSGEPMLVELIPFDPHERGATCAVDVDRNTEELLISASPTTWNRLKSVFDVPVHILDECATEHRDLVRIHRLGDGAAEALASELRALNPHLDIEADPRTGSIIVALPDDVIA